MHFRQAFLLAFVLSVALAKGWGAEINSAALSIAQEAYMKASNSGIADEFGWSVAVSGDTVVVGANYEDGAGTGINPTSNEGAEDSGAAYVFVRTGGTWAQQAYLKASNTGSGHEFGRSVAISGNTIVVGALAEGTGAGAAYVFTRIGTTWSQQAYLKAPFTGVSYFGESVGVSGDTIVVGVPMEKGSGTGINPPNNQNANSSGAVFVFTRSGTTWSHQAYLKASNTGSNDNFGAAVAVSGDTLVVGSPLEDGSGTGVNPASNNDQNDTGAAYVFVRNGTAWTQQAYLKASNSGANDNFGMSVAASGNTLVVGAAYESGSGIGVNPVSNEGAMSAGAAYVFSRSGTTWTQQAYLKASNAESEDLFGWSVTMSENTVVIGALYEDGSGLGVNPASDEEKEGAGAVYVFVRNGTTWTQQAYLKASNSGDNDNFGVSVALSNDAVIVGAYSEYGSGKGVNPTDNDLAEQAGAAYVFSGLGPAIGTPGNTPPTVTSNGGGAAASITVSENTTAVTTVNASDPDVPASQTLTFSKSGPDAARFSLNASTGVLAFTSPPDFETPTDVGANNVYEVTVSVTDSFSPAASDSQALSITVSNVNEAALAIAQQAYFKASNSQTGDLLGWSVAVSGDTVVVGAPGEDGSGTGVNPVSNENAGDSGAAYVFVRSGVTWTQQAYLKASNTGSGDYFGHSVAISGNTIVVGAYNEGGSGTGVNPATNEGASASGAAYVFTRTGSTWSQQAYLKASNTGGNDYFGNSVAVSGDTIAVGAYEENGSGTGINPSSNESAPDSGAVYVFTRSGSTWSHQAYLKASNTGSGDLFGYAVAISGDTLAVGAHVEAGSGTGVNPSNNDNAFAAGAAYVFVRNAGMWSQQAYVKASNAGTYDNFGISLAVSGDSLVVGAEGEDGSGSGINPVSNEGAVGAGAAYVFSRSGTTWTQQACLKASNTGDHDQFGHSIGISADTVVVGAFYEDGMSTGINPASNENGIGVGAAYAFIRNGGTWSQQAYLKAFNPESLDQFGYAVAVSGDTVIAGATNEDGSGTSVNASNNNLADEAGAAYVFVGLGSGTVGPEIAIEHPVGTNIPSAGLTNFGSVTVGSSADFTFALKNTGSSTLTLNGSPRVTISGTNAALFTVVEQPASSVAANSSTSFAVRFTPTSIGDKAATLSIASNDADENPFTTALSGTATNSGPVTDLPQFTGPVPPTGTIGQPYSYAFTFSNSPTSYSADGLPSGLTINSSTGVISGIPNETFEPGVTAYHHLIGLYATNSSGTGWTTVHLTIQASDDSEPQGGFAPAKLNVGTEFAYEGLIDDSLEGEHSESRTITITSATAFTGGTYTYTKTGADTAKLTYKVSISEADYKETENGIIFITFTSATEGTFTSTGSYSGTFEGEPFSGTFNGEGTFNITGLVVAPVVTTLTATEISATGVKLNATVNAKGSDRNVVFEYGPTITYGNSVSANVSISGDVVVSASAVVPDLDPHTTYYFRVKAEGELGTAVGLNKTFTTLNRAPVASSDDVALLPYATVSIPVLDNDVELDGDDFSVLSFTQPGAAVGKVAKVGSELTFTAGAKFTGGSFTYIVVDAFSGKSTAATVTLSLGACSLSPATVFVAASASNHTVAVTADGNWSAIETLPWITAAPAISSGNRDVSVALQANTTKVSRTGVINIGGQMHTVIQAGTSGFTIEAPAEVPEGMVSAEYYLEIPALTEGVKFTAKGLPSGLSIDQISGLVSGTPKSSGRFYASIVGTAITGASTTIPVSITIHPLPIGTVGTFHGPVTREADLIDNNNLGGRFELTTTQTGSFSGKVTLGAKTYPFTKGQLHAALGSDYIDVSFSISRKAPLPALEVRFTIDSANNALIDGDIHDGTHHATFAAWRNVWITPGLDSARRADLNRYLGLHTFALQPLLAEPALPQGSGFGAFTIAAKTGALTVAGKLADGTAFTCGTFAGANGEILLFQPLYSNKGSLLGRLNILAGTEDFIPPYGDNVLEGSISWNRPAIIGRTYPDGFEPVDLTAVGGRYVPPIAPELILGITDALTDNSRLSFAGADIITATPDIAFRLKAKNVFVQPIQNPSKTTFSVAAAKGSFTGSFTLSDPNDVVGTAIRPATFYGQILRDSDNVLRGYGFFLLADSPEATGDTVKNTRLSSGQVILEKVPGQ